MALLSLNNLTFTYSKPNLLDGITLHIERGERIGLVGRNGAGKSTLMKLIAGLLKPDDGSVDLQSEGVIARLDQEVPSGGDKTAFEMAAEGFGPLCSAVSDYRNIGHKLHEGVELTEKELKAYEDASHMIADADELQYELRTAGGSRNLWGRGPESQHPGELTVALKIQRLSDFHAVYDGFDDQHGPYQIDIRPWHGIQRGVLARESTESRLR